MADLIAAQLNLLSEDQKRRIDLTGPRLQLPPSNAQNLGLALHELVINSIKYGALSRESGRVTIDWRAVDGSDPPLVRLTWTEAGGPAVVAPERLGFGRIMLERLVPRALNGEASLDFAPSGFAWTLTVPLKALQPDEPQLGARNGSEPASPGADTAADGVRA
jgi:two-component sensor histidine kinase